MPRFTYRLAKKIFRSVWESSISDPQKIREVFPLLLHTCKKWCIISYYFYYGDCYA